MRLEVEACVLCFQLPNWEMVGSLRGTFFKSNRDSTSTFLWPCQARLACLFSVFSLQCQELSDFCEESPRHRMADSIHRVKLLPPWGNEVARSARTSRQKNKRRWAEWSGTVFVAGTCRTKMGLLSALELANRKLRTFII